MIPIKIGKKKFKIKTIAELNTAEFIELTKQSWIQQQDSVFQYIKWKTKTTYEDAFFAKISETVESRIGTVPDITKLSFSKLFDKKKTIETIGQRHQIESSELTGYELLVFCLAVSQAQSVDITKVIKLQNEYMELSFIDVLPSGFFFFNRYKYGKRSVRTLLSSLRLLIKTKKLRKAQGSKD